MFSREGLIVGSLLRDVGESFVGESNAHDTTLCLAVVEQMWSTHLRSTGPN